MNTAKILDIMPQPPPVALPGPQPSGRPDPRVIAPVNDAGATGLADRQAREAARQAQDEAAQHQAAKAERPRMQQEVGIVGGSFRVFVDLINPPSTYRMRIFGPSDSAAPPPPASPAKVRAAYATSLATGSLGSVLRAEV